jgi:GTP cyclohydrolase IA
MKTEKRSLDELAERFNKKPDIDQESVRDAVQQMLAAFGENPAREGLIRTPDRVARMYEELLAGYRVDPIAMINDACFEVTYDEMVVVRDIEFYSLCEHHLLPFMGRAHVAYLPKGPGDRAFKDPSYRGYVRPPPAGPGASHPPDLGLHRRPAGAAWCGGSGGGPAPVLMMRGVKKHGARMTTSAMHGAFRSSLATRQEFLDNISRGSEPLQF